jgi:hypothetical protein
MECRCFLCYLYLRDFHWDSPSGCVINISSEEVGNNLKSKVKLLISYPSFLFVIVITL